MENLAEIVVASVAFLTFEDSIDQESAIRELQDIGTHLLHASAQEREAVLSVCRRICDALPADADPDVKAFYRDFGEVFCLHPD
jgi:hypothetical protein